MDPRRPAEVLRRARGGWFCPPPPNRVALHPHGSHRGAQHRFRAPCCLFAVRRPCCSACSPSTSCRSGDPLSTVQVTAACGSPVQITADRFATRIDHRVGHVLSRSRCQALTALSPRRVGRRTQGRPLGPGRPGHGPLFARGCSAIPPQSRRNAAAAALSHPCRAPFRTRERGTLTFFYLKNGRPCTGPVHGADLRWVLLDADRVHVPPALSCRDRRRCVRTIDSSNMDCSRIAAPDTHSPSAFTPTQALLLATASATHGGLPASSVGNMCGRWPRELLRRRTRSCE